MNDVEFIDDLIQRLEWISKERITGDLNVPYDVERLIEIKEKLKKCTCDKNDVDISEETKFSYHCLCGRIIPKENHTDDCQFLADKLKELQEVKPMTAPIGSIKFLNCNDLIKKADGPKLIEAPLVQVKPMEEKLIPEGTIIDPMPHILYDYWGRVDQHAPRWHCRCNRCNIPSWREKCDSCDKSKSDSGQIHNKHDRNGRIMIDQSFEEAKDE